MDPYPLTRGIAQQGLSLTPDAHHKEQSRCKYSTVSPLNAGVLRCRCLARAQKLQLPHIEAYARLVLAKFSLQHNTAIAGPISMEEEHYEAGMSNCCSVARWLLCKYVSCVAASSGIYSLKDMAALLPAQSCMSLTFLAGSWCSLWMYINVPLRALHARLLLKKGMLQVTARQPPQ